MLNASVQQDRVGFVGIGEMGFGMATSVLDTGIATIAFDLREEALEAFADRGGETMDALDELARTCRAVHVVVQDDEQVNAVARGAAGLFAGFETKAEHGVIVVHSSVRPDTCTALAADAPENVSIVDAPVSGGRSRAEAGELAMMIGGDDTAIEYCRPVFDAMARDVFHVGEVGMGQTAKLAHNTTAVSNLMTTAEGLRLGEAYGIDREILLDIFQSGAANSNMLRQWRDVFADDAAAVDSERIERGAELGQKDLYHALELARDADVELVGAAVASQTVPGYLRSRAEEE